MMFSKVSLFIGISSRVLDYAMVELCAIITKVLYMLIHIQGTIEFIHPDISALPPSSSPPESDRHESSMSDKSKRDGQSGEVEHFYVARLCSGVNDL